MEQKKERNKDKSFEINGSYKKQHQRAKWHENNNK